MKHSNKILSGLFIINLLFILVGNICGKNSEFIRENRNVPIPDTLIRNSPIKTKEFNLELIPPSTGVQFYKDGIVFLSSSKFDEKMIENQISFGKLDARYAVLKDTLLENKQVFSSDKPFPYPCESVTFSRDYNIMYFTRFSDKAGVEQIFEAKYSPTKGNEGNWTLSENPLSLCSDKSIYTHPTLSADGNLMIFASNKQGTIGGMDLFVSQKKNGVWGEPKNLGDAVNSTANEIYPFLDQENNLYFSSDGVNGYGGYDIYVCKFKSNTWEKPINLSAPINTKADDIAFTLSRKDGKSGFYSVRQNSGRRSHQLYMISLNASRNDTLLSLSQYFTRPDVSQMVILVLEPAVQATDKVTQTASVTRGEKDIITYRVQFMTSFNPKTRSQITVAGTDYKVFEYLFSGAYRLCVGEFSSLSPAIELQNLLRKNDYMQANVVAFKNNIVSLDPALLKEQPGLNKVTVLEEKKVTDAAPVISANQKAVADLNKDKPEAAIKKTETAKVTTQPEVKKTEEVKTPIPEPSVKKDVVVFRVQIITNNSPKGSYKITLGNKTFNTFEYQYAGAYRTCVGEFSTLSLATEFQKSCRQSGYPQAFVVAFRNNVRSTDPSLFK
jgi:hypothetical protein